MRDMARFGLLFTPSYSVVSDEKIVSDKTLNLLLNEPNDNLVEVMGRIVRINGITLIKMDS